MIFIVFILFLISLRLAELYVSSKNEKWLLKNGAAEYGKEHYPFMVTMHTLFIISVIAEYMWRDNTVVSYPLIVLFFVLIVIKIIVISTLGHYWNTKIYKVPGTRPVATGIYKYIKHPNYIIVILEIAIIPLAFGLYYTAIAFTLLNAAMLYVRIKKENEVLAM
ncbi:MULTISPECIES: isoprenylcysteine carboxylmethyltransferase family protein [unclassified Mucilaginibacter]|uniref:isoprenylcysteine carboxyl methyltransferase family protein n=1 Tax=unclassified Mucilaginibacter TaxID=2617802 RepID=UPI002AC93F53|nr:MULTISPECIES: isoprenylcysteine carboxylmethyltransferase family protein [unclassified Mucilaginibacter]MEB0263671.1 isoprenylcysteine carboxylmethyltransferase family protein [Mucilaginibacter sp. 10I4]MEB0277014.1 isoprenylcysteine carboxylmethyltransferase family protein [Mucilaginibacter sp. 10B2]MEB0302612.1 isoprenylcysteine carboxylmethyltransferase family protein [Mucilaginibacter sp. 5C4]WPX25114.1 isoprenylcysteine carboxylmethyltransferase family protein [Mucilaginibacter sp. 5C4]